ELGAREVGRGDLEGPDDPAEALLAAGLPHLEVGAVEVDERELTRDEEAGADREHEPGGQHDPFSHGGCRIFERAYYEVRPWVCGEVYLPRAATQQWAVTKRPAAPCPPRTRQRTGCRRAPAPGTPRARSLPRS